MPFLFFSDNWLKYLLEIQIQKSFPEQTISGMGIKSWPLRSCEKSTFTWSYSKKESCLLLEGDVMVTPDGGEPVKFGADDLVEFSEGLLFMWEVQKAVRKYYKFG